MFICSYKVRRLLLALLLVFAMSMGVLCDEEVYVSFETGGDDFNPLGDVNNTEFWIAMRFTTAATITCTSASTYIDFISETPDGDMSFRIETNDALDEPSGTLVHANATGTIAYGDIVVGGWNKCTFGTPFEFAAGTYWIIVYLPDQSKDDGYAILCDANGIGATAESIDHGASWSVGVDNYINYFRVYRQTGGEEHPTTSQLLNGGMWYNSSLKHSDWCRFKRGTDE